MDKNLKQLLIDDGIKECEQVLTKDKKLLEQFPNGEQFFKGCLMGFMESKDVFCLEQLEIKLMKLADEEEKFKQKINIKKTNATKERKLYADCKGKRCAIEFLYKSLANMQEK